MLATGILSVCLVGFVSAQLDAFALPSAQRYAPKPTVPPEFSNYFELDGHARELVDSLLGPRPGGLFPEKTFEIGAPQIPVQNGNQPQHVVSKLERTLESFFTAPETPPGQALPPGFGSGFSLLNNNKALTSFGDIRRSPSNKQDDTEVVEGSGDGKSSIAGIPNVFPKLPKPPTERLEPVKTVAVQRDSIGMPVMETAPSVPEGGFLPTSDVRRAPSSVSEVSHSIDDKADDLNTEEYGGLSDDSNSSGGGLIGTIFNLIKLGGKKAKDAPAGEAGAPSAPTNASIGNALAKFLQGRNSPLPKPGTNPLLDMIIKTLSGNSLENNGTTVETNNGSIVLTPAQSAAISSNLEMIQDLIIKPSSPLCTQKPNPVEFELDPLMGQWYQVIYSPPVSTGPCSMVSYKKLSDNGEETGSIIDVYEYTTDGTPYGKPIISSGYALVKGKGELIFRTNSNKDDVTVHILSVGPINHQGEYDYVVMSTNCNYPVYVFARDASMFKQKYEPIVNEFLDKNGVVNGITRLLNVVAPVDNTMCIFPPHLFYNQGK